MAKLPKFYKCRYCHDDLTVEQGYNLLTKQCPSCQKWDDEKALRDKKWADRQNFLNENIDFPYVPGDPFW